MKKISHYILLILSTVIFTITLSACGIGGDDPTESTTSSSNSSNNHNNASVWVTNASIKKQSGYSNYKITYTIKTSGVSASEISEIGCTSNKSTIYSSSKRGVTSYSYTSGNSVAVTTYLTPYIKFKDGTKKTGSVKYVSVNS